ncbi:MAG: RNA 2',3'-cyclic phosphodiesterase [Bacteroidales bacterium]|jgi:2'-5' RNA ligase
MKRTFIAVKIEAGEKLVEVFNVLKEDLMNESVRWVDIGKMHITLAFLGDTSEETIREVSVMLRNVCNGFGQFSFSLAGLGVFRNMNDPRVIWGGIGNSEKLAALFTLVESGLHETGIETEEREFKPHLTIGRIKWIKEKKALEAAVSKYSGFKFQDVNVTEVIFYESILQQTGPLYLPIKVFKLS